MSFESDFAKYIDRPSVKKQFKTFVSSGGGGTGGIVESQEEALAIAREAIKIIIDSLPTSLRTGPCAITEQSMIINPVKVNKDGNFEIGLSWNPHTVHRDSLYLDGDNDGIEDIVHLFTTGYSASQYAYGVWDRHSSYAIRSKINREPSTFLKDAVQNYNRVHAKEGITLLISDFYFKRKTYGL